MCDRPLWARPRPRIGWQGSATATFVPATLAAIADLKRQLIAHAGAGEDGREPDWAEVLASAPDLRCARTA